MGVGYRVDILTAAGAVVGSGPITSVSAWSVTRRMDRAGDWSFTMAATDPQRSQVQLKRKVAIYAQMGGGWWMYFGGGTIDRIQKAVADDGKVTLTVSGADALRDLVYEIVSGEYTATLSEILTAIEPSGWSFSGSTDYTGDLYISFQYDTLLSALGRLAERSWGHFYLDNWDYGTGIVDAVTFTSNWTENTTYLSTSESGLVILTGRALQAWGDLGTTQYRRIDDDLTMVWTQAAIVDLQIESQSYDLITRVYPLGAGSASPLTLKAISEAPPTGYTVEANYGYVQHTAGVAAYGVLSRVVQFKDIRPVSGTDFDVVAASTAMMKAAVFYLQEHAAPVTSYRIALAQCQAVLKPMQYIRVDYRDSAAGIELAENLYILESTVSGTVDGVSTTSLVVADAGRWPESDSGAVVGSIAQGEVFQVHPQLNANSYVIPYYVPVDQTETAQLRFRFDAEVLMVNRVTMDVKLTALESTVKSTGGTSTTTGSGGSSTPTTSSGGSSTPTSASTDISHTHIIDVGSPQAVTNAMHVDASGVVTAAVAASIITTSTGGSHSHDVTIAGHTHSVTIAGHTHDVTASITTTYGIYRAPGGELFDLEDDLEYSINGTTWYAWGTGINGYDASLGDSWVRVDLTALLSSTTTFRPNSANNAVRIRRKTAGATGKAAMINAQINIRTIIQAVALT